MEAEPAGRIKPCSFAVPRHRQQPLGFASGGSLHEILMSCVATATRRYWPITIGNWILCVNVVYMLTAAYTTFSAQGEQIPGKEAPLYTRIVMLLQSISLPGSFFGLASCLHCPRASDVRMLATVMLPTFGCFETVRALRIDRHVFLPTGVTMVATARKPLWHGGAISNPRWQFRARAGRCNREQVRGVYICALALRPTCRWCGREGAFPRYFDPLQENTRPRLSFFLRHELPRSAPQATLLFAPRTVLRDLLCTVHAVDAALPRPGGRNM